jgi:hypothetical protein
MRSLSIYLILLFLGMVNSSIGFSQDTTDENNQLPEDTEETSTEDSDPDEDVTENIEKPDLSTLSFNINITLQVDVVEETIETLRKLIDEHNGYTQSWSNTMIDLRIPTENRVEAFNKIKELGKVMHESTTSQDLRMELVDLTSRIISTSEQRIRFLDILQKAQTAQEILTLQAEIQSLTQTLEQYQGRMRFLEQQTKFTPITVTLQGLPEQLPQKQNYVDNFYWLSKLGVNHLMRLRQED